MRKSRLSDGYVLADQIVRESARVGLLELTGEGRASVSVASALRSVVAQRVADASGPATGPRRTRGLSPRGVAYRAREVGRAVAIDACLKHEAGEVVYAPRTWTHVRDMLALDAQLAARHVFRRSWFVFTAAMRASLRGAGPLVSGRNMRRAFASAARLRREAAALCVRVRAARWGIGRRDDDVLIDIAEGIFEDNALGVAGAFHAAEEAIGPMTRLVIVGNPRTTEGYVVASVARARGIPVACMQHGLELAGDEGWRGVPVDLVCAWGEAGARAMRESGIPEDAIAVTGAGWTDALVLGRAARSRQVLVALSGAGHRVGMAEHLSHLDRLFACAGRMSDVRFVFRLHPKDDVSLYRERAAGLPHANIIVTEHGAGVDIHSQLAETGALITVTSTSALDAMLHAVPVITFDRAAGEDVPDYVQVGATHRVPLGMDLDAVVRDVLAAEPSAAMTESVASCLRDTWGAIDGHASSRIADELQRRFLGKARS